MTTESVLLLPFLAFGAMLLLVIGVQGLFQQRSARLTTHLGRFTASAVDTGRSQRAQNEDLRRAKRRFSRFAVLDRYLGRQGFTEGLDRELAAAAVPLRVGEYLLVRWACALVAGGAAGSLSGIWMAALPAGVVAFFVPVVYVRYLRARRLALVNEQLIDALALIAGGLRSGYSFLQGIEAVVRELPAPVGEEFRVVLEDLRIGVPVEEALGGLVKRVPTEDVDMLVTSMLVQRTSGGNLAEILENLSQTIRDRIRIRREVNTLTAQERMSSYVVGALPIAAFAFLSLTTPDYLDLLFAETMGQVMLAGAAVLEVIGFIVMRKIMDIGL